jgi:glyoxylase-like metal-dependent hydrolase (beta-lactamase superfamily II)
MHLTRRDFLLTSSVALAVRPVFAQTPAMPPPAVPPRFETLRNNVGVFLARGGTIGWLVASDGVVIVDSQFSDTAATALAGIRQKTSRPIDVLINSHHHGDHTGGNQVFRPAVGKIVSHARVPGLMRTVAVANKTEASQAYPDTTFDTAWSTKMGGETILAKYYGPAHTGGDIAIHFQNANIVHMGDLMSSIRHPRVDRPSGASVKGWISVLEKIAKDHNGDTIFIAGHAKAGTPVTVWRQDLLAFRDYFSAVLASTQKGIASGKSVDEIVKGASLPDDFAEYEGTPENAIRAAHDELTTQA